MNYILALEDQETLEIELFLTTEAPDIIQKGSLIYFIVHMDYNGMVKFVGHLTYLFPQHTEMLRRFTVYKYTSARSKASYNDLIDKLIKDDV